MVEGNTQLLRTIDRGPPGDVSMRQQQTARKTKPRPEIAQQRSSYFEDVLQATREINPVREKVRGESMVTAEVKTNVIVRPILVCH
jgi:hypothetical protein